VNTALSTHQNVTIFSKHFQWLDWEEMAETARRIGFNGIDLTVRPGGHVKPERVEDDLPKVCEICNKVGIKVEMLCTNIQNASDPITGKILKTASKLGIKNYRMGWYFYDKNISLSKNLETFTSMIKDLAEVNFHYKIMGNYQNHNGSNWFGAPVWDLAGVLKKINSNWMGSQYDILNATIEASSAWSLGIELIAPFIKTIDIKDAVWITDNSDNQRLKYIPLGRGMVDFPKFFHLLKEFKIQVPFSLHFEYDLGGADLGLRELKIPPKNILSAIKNDLRFLKRFF
jgi:sugar phosphate isomerase/epimerase